MKNVRDIPNLSQATGQVFEHYVCSEGVFASFSMRRVIRMIIEIRPELTELRLRFTEVLSGSEVSMSEDIRF